MFRDKEILRKIVSEKKEESKNSRQRQSANVSQILRHKFPYLFGGENQRESSVSLNNDRERKKRLR